MDTLSGKVALITGASRGIGEAIAYSLANAGVDIVANYRERRQQAAVVQSKIENMGRRCLAVQADVSRQDDVEHLVRSAESEFGRIDILVNNAGIARPQSLDQVTERDWDDLHVTNLKSCFLMTQAVLPGMRARKWGRIINLSSVAAQVGGVVGPHYAASKAGMLGLTHYYAAHLAKEGITANAIAPALIETEMVTSNLNATPGRIPMGRFGTVEEVAEVVLMLARNGYISGQTINVNGGWVMS